MFHILTVCTANICRSAMAAAQLESLVAAAGLTDSVSVSSRGVRAEDGYPACPLGFGYVGLHIPEHRSARLDEASIAGAHLIVTAESAHRAAVVTMYPKARSRVFTMTEAAALTTWYVDASAAGVSLPSPADDGGVDERLAWWVRELNDSRGAAPIAQLDIGDPHMVVRGPDTHEVTAQEIATAMGTIVAGFTFALSRS